MPERAGKERLEHFRQLRCVCHVAFLGRALAPAKAPSARRE